MRYTITIAAVLARVFFCATLLPSFIFSQGGAWSSKTSMTTARWHSGIGVINNTLYVAGGYNGSHQTAVEAYNFTSNTWTTKNTRPVQTSAAYGVIGNTLYTAGGTNVSVRISDVWAYDPGLDSWTTRAPIPNLRSNPGSAVVNNILYAIGGVDNSSVLSSMDAYDPSGNAWASKAAMSVPRQAPAVGVIQGIIYVAGGFTTGNAVTDVLEAYNPVTNTWSTKAVLPTARGYAVAAVLDDKLYVMGGVTVGGGSAIQTVEVYDPVTDTWSGGTPMKTGRAGLEAFTYENKIYTIGGWSGVSTASSVLEAFSGRPVIFSFTPAFSPVDSIVTITGNNFSAVPQENVVYFGSVKATVNTASITQLTVTVPAGQNFKPISVTVGGYTAFAKKPFFVTKKVKSTIDESSFDTRIELTSGNNPKNVASGDIDGDGKPDLIISNFDDNTISVYRNISSSGTLSAGSFSGPVNFNTSLSPHGMKIADMDGDGKLDVILSHSSSSFVTILRNTATSGVINASSFASAISFASGGGSQGLTVSDMDGDGRPDIIAANTNGTISVFRNRNTPGSIGAQGFAPYIDLAAGANSESVSAADIDGDNKPDIIFTNRNDNTLSIYRNQSTPDTLTTSSFSGLVNFTAATGPGKIAVADFDGDLKTDIATVNPGSATFSVFRNTATPGLINTSSLADRVDFMPGAYQISLAAGDMNSDLKPDIISVAATLSKNNTSAGSITSGSFSTAFTFNVGTQPNDVELADLDGDGLLDVSMLDYVDKKLYIYRNAMAIVPRMADSLALVDLYDSLNGNGWTNKTNWKSGNPIDTWFGITVTDGRVSHVELGNNNLSGFIPSSVGNISAIKNLNLFNNNVGGPIPATISALTEIVSLNLQNNQLTGSIPASITALTKLKHLYLDFNTLSGAIPSDIDNLTDLETLSLYQNQLSGTIPGGIWNLHKLNHLALGPNPGLSGTLPAQIENLDSLQSLFISSCGLTGSIPPEIGNLNKILMIYASDNQFTGTIPASIGNLSLLRTLHLANNNLSGSLPSSLANLHRLESLDIKENKFTDLGDLNPVDSLNVLMIEQNQFTFEDIEPNITAPRQSFTYAPQDSIGTYKDTAVTENAATSLAVSVGGSGNQYLWFKDGSSTGITTPVISFGSFAFANAGTYHCQITNTVATALTLYSRTYTVKLRGPSIPTGLTALAQSTSQINLSWSASQNNPVRYRIYRSFTSGSGFVQVDSVSHPTVTYNNTGLTADTDYYYRITAVDAAGLYSAATTQASTRTLQTAVFITSVSLLVAPTQPNENTIVTISVPVSGSAPVVKLYYAKNSSVNPDSTEMTLSSGPYVASIPASFVTAQGLWFRIRAYNNTGSEFYPSSTAKHPINVKAGASTLSAIRSSGAYPSGMIADGYSTFGLPMDTSVGIPALFGSQIFNSKNEPTNWRIQKYADGSFTDETSAFTSGTGYFVYHRLGSSVQVDIPPGSLTHAAGTFENFVLKPGWNLVPWPYTFSANFTITDESAIDPIQTQIGGNWQIVSSFKPFGAYAIKNTTASDILAGDVIQWTLSTSKVTVDYDLISDSFVRLSAVSGRYFDNDNFAGFSDAARDDDDPLDNEEPPAIGPGVNLYFTNGTAQRQYADIRSRGDGHVWDFYVNDRNNGKRINLAWDLAHIPDRMSAVLINIAENKWINLGEQTSYAFSPVKENRFKLIIGTSDFVQQTSFALAKELPSSFALHQNHPNPFNPSTTIRYDIAHAGHVRIKIYNLLGQEIVTLVDQFVNTGRYSKLWDGRDRLGNKVASGIYIYRLETSKFVRSKKMLLMK